MKPIPFGSPGQTVRAESEKDLTIIDRRCPVSEQTPEEEIFNVISHGAGALLACLGSLHLMENISSRSSTWQLTHLLLYGAAWVILFGTSTLYHASRHLGRKALLRTLDHCAIFVVIAATYGPFVVHAIDTPQGYAVWALSWVMALAGCLFKFRSKYRYHLHSTWLYFVQGGLVLLTWPTLSSNLSFWGAGWMMVGAVVMSLGTYFYIRDDIKYNHGAWHLCVLLSSLGFFLAVLDAIGR